eukprot:m.213035 g.213035  ORF g.213035 m.213035 type:complete len:318 (-) comp18597_c0_seq1:882-1835(-)
MVLPPPPMLSLTSEATLAACKVINVTEQAGRRGGLVLVCSYPKSGTTVMQNVVLRLCILAQQRHNQVTGGGGEHRDSIHTEDRGKVHTENRGGVDNGVDDGALSKHGYPLSLCDVRHISDWTPFFEIDPHWVPCSDTRASCRAGGIIIAKGTAAAGTATADDAPQLQPASHIAAAHRLLGRRVYNTHLPWNMLPGTAASPPSSPAPPPPPPSLFPSPSPNWPRYIYMVRNGKDVLASFWYHLSNQEGGFDGDLVRQGGLLCVATTAHDCWQETRPNQLHNTHTHTRTFQHVENRTNTYPRNDCRFNVCNGQNGVFTR